MWDIWGASPNDVHSYNNNVSIAPNLTMQTYINGNHHYLDLHTKPYLDITQFTDSVQYYCDLYTPYQSWYNTDPTPPNYFKQPLSISQRPAVDYSQETQIVVKWVPQVMADVVLGGNYHTYFNMARAALDTNIDDSMLDPLQILYHQFHSSYLELFSDTNIAEVNRPMEENQYYNTLLDLQNALINRSLSNDQPYRFMRMELNRDLALIHRAFNHRNDGIAHINNVINDFPNPNDRQILETWKCILTQEQMYLDTLIPYDSVRIYGCIPNYFFDDSSHNFMQIGFDPWLYNGNSEENNNYAPNPSGLTPPPATKKQPTTSNLTLFPNPAENSYTIVCNEAMFNIRVTDNTGRVIQTLKANGQKSLLIDASNYSRGIYFVEAYSTDKRFVQRLLINK